jgi:hypothetical protein
LRAVTRIDDHLAEVVGGVAISVEERVGAEEEREAADAAMEQRGVNLGDIGRGVHADLLQRR